jgi:hypothetical protein
MDNQGKARPPQAGKGALAKWVGLDWPALVLLLVSGAVVSFGLMVLLYRVAVVPELEANRVYYVFNVEQAEARMRTGYIRERVRTLDEAEDGESPGAISAEPERFEQQWQRIKGILAAFPRPVFIKGAMIEAGAGTYSIVDITEDVLKALEEQRRG